MPETLGHHKATRAGSRYTIVSTCTTFWLMLSPLNERSYLSFQTHKTFQSQGRSQSTNKSFQHLNTNSLQN